MFKSFLIFIIYAFLVGCKTHQSVASMTNLDPAKEIRYKVIDGEEKTVTDPQKIEKIIQILYKAKRNLVKFIPKSELTIRKENGIVISILKGEHALNIEGVTYTIKEKQKQELSELLQ